MDMTSTINDLIDIHDEGMEDHKWVKAILVDLEDPSRRNNFKLRCMPESVQNADLKKICH